MCFEYSKGERIKKFLEVCDSLIFPFNSRSILLKLDTNVELPTSLPVPCQPEVGAVLIKPPPSCFCPAARISGNIPPAGPSEKYTRHFPFPALPGRQKNIFPSPRLENVIVESSVHLDCDLHSKFAFPWSIKQTIKMQVYDELSLLTLDHFEM